jgi:hypothetical protein
MGRYGSHCGAAIQEYRQRAYLQILAGICQSAALHHLGTLRTSATLPQSQ